MRSLGIAFAVALSCWLGAHLTTVELSREYVRTRTAAPSVSRVAREAARPSRAPDSTRGAQARSEHDIPQRVIAARPAVALHSAPADSTTEDHSGRVSAQGLSGTTVTAAGIVTDPGGSPIAGAEVAFVAGHAGRVRAQTSTRGRFAVELSRSASSWTVEARHPTYRATRIPLSEPTQNLTLVLTPGARLRGVVVDTAGRPVAGAILWLHSPPGEHTPPTKTRADREGRFRFDGLGVGLHRVSAQSAGLAPRSRSIAIEATEEHTTEIALDARQRIAGEVNGPGLRPLAGTTVIASSPGGLRQHAVTGSWGEFELDSIGSRPITLSFHRPGYGSKVETAVRPGGPPLRIRLEPSHAFHGLVVDAISSGPLAGTRVTATGVGSTAVTVQTDAVGFFTLDVEEGADWMLHLEATGRVPWSGPLDEAPADRIFALTSGLTLVGRTVDERGGPVAGVLVRLRSSAEPRAAESDAEGMFELVGLAPGHHSLTATHHDHLETRLEVEINGDAETVAVILREGSTLVGRVLGAETGGHVLLSDDHRTWKTWLLDDGSFRIPRLAGGEYRLSHHVRRDGPTTTRTLHIPPGREHSVELFADR